MRAADGGLTHTSFLDDGYGDPRERFITSLLTSVPPVGTVVAYSGYEARVLSNLAESFPAYQSRLLELRQRIVDLLQMIRGGYYHPGFRGSVSIKSVVSALVPDLAYDDLDIQDGTSPAANYAHLIGGGISGKAAHARSTTSSRSVKIRSTHLGWLFNAPCLMRLEGASRHHLRSQPTPCWFPLRHWRQSSWRSSGIVLPDYCPRTRVGVSLGPGVSGSFVRAVEDLP